MLKRTWNSIDYVLQIQVTRFMVEDRGEIELFFLAEYFFLAMTETNSMEVWRKTEMKTIHCGVVVGDGSDGGWVSRPTKEMEVWEIEMEMEMEVWVCVSEEKDLWC